jgi:hypothetical protein
MFYNEWEVQSIVERTASNAQLRPYAHFLRDWVEIVNSNSDGWAYWSGGWKAAQKLAELLSKAIHVGGVPPKDADLRKALAPIRSIATKRGLPKPTLESVKKPRATKRVGTPVGYLDRARAFSQRMREMEDDPIPPGLDADGRDSDGNRREYW